MADANDGIDEGAEIDNPDEAIGFASDVFEALHAKAKEADGVPPGNTFLGPPGAQAAYACNLTEMRWGLVVRAGKEPPGALDALRTLRSVQMGAEAPVFEWNPGESVNAFLQRVSLGTVEVGAMQTTIIPYYLCLCGSPEEIPWEFQASLGSEYAVGRIHFDDPADLQRYVERLVSQDTATDAAGPPLLTPAEVEAAPIAPFAAFAPAPATGGDRAMIATHTHLIPIVQNWAAKRYGEAAGAPLWMLKAEATLKALQDALTPSDRDPRLLLSVSHGWMDKFEGDADKKEQLLGRTGAVVCEGWNGGWPPSDDVCLLADRVPGPPAKSADPKSIPGDIWYCFACFSAGGEQLSWWPHGEEWDGAVAPVRRPVAMRPYMAALPQKCLAAGLSAFVGHVSLAWDYSFLGVSRGKPKRVLFEDPLTMLVQGHRVGHAFDVCVGVRSARLGNYMREQQATATAAGAPLAAKRLFIHNLVAWNDARYTVLLGDPAARLRPKSAKKD